MPRDAVANEEAVSSVKARAEVLLHSRHAAERMLRCWGSGAGLVFEDTRDAIKKLLLVQTNSDSLPCPNLSSWLASC